MELSAIHDSTTRILALGTLFVTARKSCDENKINERPVTIISVILKMTGQVGNHTLLFKELKTHFKIDQTLIIIGFNLIRGSIIFFQGSNNIRF